MSEDAIARGQAAIEIAKKWVEYTITKDRAGSIDLMADDIVIALPFDASGRTEEGSYRRYEGKPAAIAFLDAAHAAEGTLEMFDPTYTVSADGGIVFLEIRGAIRMANGRDYRNRYVARFNVRDGLITQLLEYYNPITAAIAFGRPIAGQVTLERL